MSNIDLLMLDDNQDMIKSLEDIADIIGLEYVSFNSGLEALRFLEERAPDNLPRGYLLDMRIPGSEAELKAPLDIYRFLQKHNATDNFRFYTGNLSEHDKYVLKETSAQVILKPGMAKVGEFFEGLKVTKPQPIDPTSQ